VPEGRRHGYATAMTIAAMQVGPDRPAVLQPSSAAEPLYRSLGFEAIGGFSHWA
jgi:predicted GNAT family acetyltransferase